MAVGRRRIPHSAFRQTEAVRIEYLRRKHQAAAVIEMAQPLWRKIAATDDQIREKKTSKARKAEWIFLVLGSFIQWWLKPEGQRFAFAFNFGTIVMIGAVSSFVDNQVQVASLRKLQTQMNIQQDHLLYKWLECGAPVNYFWQFKLNAQEAMENEKLVENTDAWRERNFTIDNKRDDLWQQVLRDLLDAIDVPVP